MISHITDYNNFPGKLKLSKIQNILYVKIINITYVFIRPYAIDPNILFAGISYKH